jgi:hypothetical protein
MKQKQQTSMYYYKIGVDDSDPLALITVEHDDKGFDEFRFYEGKYIEDWPNGITFVVAGEHREDYLLGGLHWMVVSEHVRQVFEESHIEGAQFLPVTVIYKEVGQKVGIYWALNVVQEVEALDWGHTRWLGSDTIEDEYIFLNVAKEALLWEPLRNIDIFRLTIKDKSDVSVYISGHLKQCLESAGAVKGFKFIRIRAY